MQRRTQALGVLLVAAATACAGSDAPEAVRTTTAPPVTTSAVSPASAPSTPGPSTPGPSTPATPATSAPPVAALLCTPAPDGSTTIVTEPDWTVGDVRRLELRKGRTDETGVNADTFGVTPVELEVVASTSSGFAFAWRTSTSTILNAPASAETQAQLEELLAELPTQSIEYRIGSDREFLGVDNIADLRAQMLDVIVLFEEIGVFDDPEVQARLTNLYESMDDATLTVMLAEPIQLLHFFEGAELVVGDEISGADELPNALGGPVIPAFTTVGLARMIDDDGCAEIVQTTTPDPSQFGQIMVESLIESGLAPPDAPLDEAMLDFDVENRIVAQYDVAAARFRRVTATQTITVGDQTRVDTTILEDRNL